MLCFSGGTLLVAQLVEALRYKSEGRSFDSRWCHWIFYCHNPSGRTMALGSTQPLTEMSTRNIFWGYRRPVRSADNLTTFMCRLSWNLGASASWKAQGLSRPVMGLLYLYLYLIFQWKCNFVVSEMDWLKLSTLTTSILWDSNITSSVSTVVWILTLQIWKAISTT